MGFFDDTQPISPAQAVADDIRRQIVALYKQMTGTYEILFGEFWQDPINVSEILGTDAGELFRLATILATSINTAKPNSVSGVTPDGYTVTPNQDGTVTITKTSP